MAPGESPHRPERAVLGALTAATLRRAPSATMRAETEESDARTGRCAR